MFTVLLLFTGSTITGKLEQLSAACHHLGFYQNVGLSAHYHLSNISSPSVSDLRQAIFTAVATVIRKQGVLFAIPVDEGSPNAYFSRLNSIDLTRSVTFVTRLQSRIHENEDPELDALLQEQHNTNFKSEYGTLPFWRLFIIPDFGSRNAFTASFIFHHAIGDGVAGLIFHKEFQNALNAAPLADLPFDASSTVIPATDDITLLPPLEDLHPLPINEKPTQPVWAGLKEWTGGSIRAPCVTRYRTLYMSPSSSQTLIQVCKKHGLSLTAIFPSIVATELFNVLPHDVEALTCIIPVNLRPWLKEPGNDDSIGTFIDAFKIQLRRSEHMADKENTTLVPSAANGNAKEIVKYLTGNPSPTGEPYTAVAIFKTIPDVAAVFNSTLGNPRDAAVEVSNLGAFTGSAIVGQDAHWKLGRVTFSRSSVVSGSAVTMSVVTGGDGALSVGFSWQEDVVDDGVIDKLIRGVRQRLGSPTV
jgi:hypothetical protein